MEQVNAKKKNVFDNMFTKFESDEVKASASFVWMPTFYHNETEKFDSYDGVDYLLVLPGMEGHGGCLEGVCRRLKLRALLCQFITRTQPHTVQQLATILIQDLVQRIGIGKKFYILCYEFGSLLALEMAKIFEKMGLEGKLIFLKETPLSYLKSVQSLFLSHTEAQLQSALLLRLCALIEGGRPDEELEMLLEFEKGWSRKVDTCIRYLRTRCGYSTGYLRDVVDSGWLRIEQVKYYRIEYRQLKTQFILIKPHSIEADTSAENKVLGDRLTEYQVTDYDHVMEDYEVANIVNEVVLGEDV